MPITQESYRKLNDQFDAFEKNHAVFINNNPNIKMQIQKMRNIAKVNESFSNCFGDFIGSRALRKRIHEIMVADLVVKPGCEDLNPFTNVELDELFKSTEQTRINLELNTLSQSVTRDLLKNNIFTTLEKTYITTSGDDETVIKNVLDYTCGWERSGSRPECSPGEVDIVNDLARKKLTQLKKENPQRYSISEAKNVLQNKIQELNRLLTEKNLDGYQEKYNEIIKSDLGFLLKFGDLASEFGKRRDSLESEEEVEPHGHQFNIQDVALAASKFKGGQRKKVLDSFRIRRDIAAEYKDGETPKNAIVNRKDDLKTLIKHDFGSFARSLLKSPNQADDVCELIKELEKDEHEAKAILDGTENYSLGATLLFGGCALAAGGLTLGLSATGIGLVAVPFTSKLMLGCGVAATGSALTATGASAYKLYQAQADLDSAIAADLSNTGDEKLVAEVAKLRGEVSDIAWDLGTNAAMTIGAAGLLKIAGTAYKAYGKKGIENIKDVFNKAKTDNKLALSMDDAAFELDKLFPGRGTALLGQALSGSKRSKEILDAINDLKGDKKGIEELLKKLGPIC